MNRNNPEHWQKRIVRDAKHAGDILEKKTVTLEIITTEDGPPDVAFDWFPGLHLKHQSKWFRIYMRELEEPLSKIRQGWLEGWKEKDQIVAWWCE